MDSDLTIRNDVLDELEYDPQIDAAAIGVTVRDGIATLTGHVGSFAEKIAAEEAVRRVKGVRAMAEDIEVLLPGEALQGDEALAARATAILAWSVAAPKEGVKVQVDHGWVTLHGQANWGYQRDDAERAVRRLAGVKGVSNFIEVVNSAAVADIRGAIKRAFNRSAAFDASGIDIVVDGNAVTLSGQVRSWSERVAAEQAAWAAPGVSRVVDQITVR